MIAHQTNHSLRISNYRASVQEAGAGTCISPVRRSNLRSAYMSQVKEWHSLFKDGAITEEEYEQQKEKILGDLGKL